MIVNDSNHTNLAITDPPINTSVSPDVLNVLYYMSSHLPVSIKVAVTLLAPRVIADNNLSGSKNSFGVFPNPTNSLLDIKESNKVGTYEMLLKNSLGQIIIEEKYEIINNQINSQLFFLSLFRGI